LNVTDHHEENCQQQNDTYSRIVSYQPPNCFSKTTNI